MTYLTYQQTPLELLDSIDYSIVVHSTNINNAKKYGDPCPVFHEKALGHLLPLRESLKREAFRNSYGVTCFMGDQEVYAPYIKKEIPTVIIVDDNGEESWILNNPGCTCINKEQWEQCSFNFCNSIGITFKVTTEQVCNLAFEITRNIIDPCIGIALAITTKAVSMGYGNQRTSEDCKLDYTIAVEKGCDLDYTVYKKAYQSGLTYDLIKLIYDNNLELIYEDGCIWLRSPLTKYKIANFFYNNALGDAEFKKLVEEDPRKFVKKYLSDYNLKETDIIKILQ